MAARYPPLSEPWNGSLRDAVAFVRERFDPLGIVACGSVVRGEPDAASDHDLQVIVSGTRRQRLQRRFRGVPVEIFVAPPAWIRRSLAEGVRLLRPATAHMLATGFVVLERDPVVAALRGEARAALESGPRVDPAALTWSRYASATMVEDAFDLADRDPDGALFLATTAVNEMLRFVVYPAHGRWVPGWKALFAGLAEVDAAAATLARRFYRAADPRERLELAGALADHICGARGFFEWESPPEELEPGPGT